MSLWRCLGASFPSLLLFIPIWSLPFGGKADGWLEHGYLGCVESGVIYFLTYLEEDEPRCIAASWVCFSYYRRGGDRRMRRYREGG
ncbi:hypothetical protein V8F33_011257 [Rhypophila sp. PSN 637]